MNALGDTPSGRPRNRLPWPVCAVLVLLASAFLWFVLGNGLALLLR